MTFYLDTNIVVDVISERDGYEDSLQILRYCEVNLVSGFVSTTTVTDVMYILRKYLTPEIVRDAVKTFLQIVNVADVLKNDIFDAFSSEIRDFEDAVQGACAQRIKADYIITRNIKDFKKSSVPVLLPHEALELLKNIF